MNTAETMEQLIDDIWKAGWWIFHHTCKSMEPRVWVCEVGCRKLDKNGKTAYVTSRACSTPTGALRSALRRAKAYKVEDKSVPVNFAFLLLDKSVRSEWEQAFIGATKVLRDE